MSKRLTMDDPRLTQSFGQLAFIVNRHLVDHMRRMASGLDMDFEAAYIWGVLSHLNVAHMFAPGGTRPDVPNAPNVPNVTDLAPVPARLTDLSQITGLPRETVRRKLEQLRSMGKVERTHEGSWIYAASGIDEQTIAFTKETIMRFYQTAEEVATLLRRIES